MPRFRRWTHRPDATSVNMMGGYKVQAKADAIEQLMRDAVALDRAGVACIYLEAFRGSRAMVNRRS